MRKFLPAFVSVLAVCLGYISAKPIAELLTKKAQNPLPSVSFEDAKTDVISVAVFDGEKVKGYLSFRVAFMISNEARVPEVGYLASDFAIRKYFSTTDIETNLSALSKRMEGEIKTHLEGKLPAELVNSVRIADFGFDARV